MLSYIFLSWTICSFCSWWWLLPLLLLAWLLGWLYEWLNRQRLLDRINELKRENGRLVLRSTELEKEITSLKYDLDKVNTNYNSLRSKNADLDIKLRACTEQRGNLEYQIQTLQENIAEEKNKIEKETVIEKKVLEEDVEPSTDDNMDNEIVVGDNVDDSIGLFAGDSQEDDTTTLTSENMGIGAMFDHSNLQIIEGIGPKIEGLLHDAGFKTWGDLGNSEEANIQAVLDAAGPRYRVHNPKTWGEQARLAANGDWDALIKYQKFLDTGRDTGAVGNTPSKVEKLYAKKIGFAAFKPNDLKVIEGIGPKIAALLHDAGINTWAELATTSVNRIQEVLDAAGDSYRLADPKTWPKQAALAADGKWAELKTYQDFLDGGRE